jgi:hypothetical protein
LVNVRCIMFWVSTSSIIMQNVRTKARAMLSHSRRLVQKVRLTAQSDAESGSEGS